MSTMSSQTSLPSQPIGFMPRFGGTRKQKGANVPAGVTLISQKLVKPKSWESNNPKDIWKATPIDRMFLECDARIDICWVFNRQVDPAAFEQSLQQVLDEFRPFAGRYDPWNKRIIMNDKGIRFQFCENKTYDLERVLQENHKPEFTPMFVDDRASLLAHARVYFVEDPFMTVRLTHLKGETGCVVGMRLTHGICDGQGLARLALRLSEICHGKQASPALAILPQNDFPMEFSASEKEIKEQMRDAGWSHIPMTSFLRLLYANTRKGLSPFNRLRSTPFHISKVAIERIKAVATLDLRVKLGGQAQPNLSSNDALSAFLCQLLARLFDFEDEKLCGHNTKMDWRGRLEAFKDLYFGNASSGVLTCKFRAGGSLGEVAAGISQGTARFAPNSDEMQRNVLLNWGRAKYRIAGTMADPRTMPMLSSKPSTFVINNLLRFPVYAMSYGVGKPVMVVPQHTGDEVIIWPRADGNGGDIYFQGPSAHAISHLGEQGVAWLKSELGKFESCGEAQAELESLARNDAITMAGQDSSLPPAIAKLTSVPRRPSS